MVQIIDDKCRLPKGTIVEIAAYSSITGEYFVRNVESDYHCWAAPESLSLFNGGKLDGKNNMSILPDGSIESGQKC